MTWDEIEQILREAAPKCKLNQLALEHFEMTEPWTLEGTEEQEAKEFWIELIDQGDLN